MPTLYFWNLTYPDKDREEAESNAGPNVGVTIVSPGVWAQSPLVGQATERDQVQQGKEAREYQVSKHKLFLVICAWQQVKIILPYHSSWELKLLSPKVRKEILKDLVSQKLINRFS